MSHAKRVTKDIRKNPEYHVVAIRRLQTGKNFPAEKSWPTMLKMSSISELKRPTTQKTMNSLNTIMQRTANKNDFFRSFTDLNVYSSLFISN